MLLKELPMIVVIIVRLIRLLTLKDEGFGHRCDMETNFYAQY